MTQPRNSNEAGGGLVKMGAEAGPDQVNFFHRYSDKDGHPDAQHHTLGLDPHQASPGDHNHDGANSVALDYPDPPPPFDPSGLATVPVGTVIIITAGKVPAGYLLCNGVTLLKTDYPELFAHLGSYYGGNGTTTFGLPVLFAGPPNGGSTVEYAIKT